MALSIASRDDHGLAVVAVHGNLTLGPRLRTFQSRIERVIAESGCVGLVLNLSGVTVIDSAGIGQLVAIRSAAVSRKIPVVLVGVNHRVKEIMAITRVDGLFTFAGDEPSASALLRT